MEYSGHKEHFRRWLPSGTPTLLAGGDRAAFFLVNEGGPQLRIGNVTGTPLAVLGTLLPSGSSHADGFTDDEWWAFNLGNNSGSVSGYIVRDQ